jgi:hypothetical protein
VKAGAREGLARIRRKNLPAREGQDGSLVLAQFFTDHAMTGPGACLEGADLTPNESRTFWMEIELS